MKTSGSISLTLIAASCSLSILALVQGADAATISVYTDKNAWINALKGASFQTEDFSDTILNPGVAVSSNRGFVLLTPDPESGESQVWRDKIGANLGNSKLSTTTWQFSPFQFGNGIFAWGGKWNLNKPGGPGTGITATVNLFKDGQQLVQQEIPNILKGDFWGIVSDTTFTDVKLSRGSVVANFENYTFDDMVYASTPEASSVLGILGIGALGVTSLLKRKHN